MLARLEAAFGDLEAGQLDSCSTIDHERCPADEPCVVQRETDHGLGHVVLRSGRLLRLEPEQDRLCSDLLGEHSIGFSAQVVNGVGEVECGAPGFQFDQALFPRASTSAVPIEARYVRYSSLPNRGPRASAPPRMTVAGSKRAMRPMPRGRPEMDHALDHVGTLAVSLGYVGIGTKGGRPVPLART